MTILGRSEELVSRCVECDLAEPESLASLGGSAPGVVDGFLSRAHCTQNSTPSGLYNLQHFAPGNFSSRANPKTGKKPHRPFLYSTSVLFA